MLKIKDNVDLKELEKFGFEASECSNGVIQYRKTIYEDGDLAYFYLDIYDCDRKFDSIWGTGHKDFIDIEFLFDLIQAGLVEKGENEKIHTKQNYGHGIGIKERIARVGAENRTDRSR